MLITIPKNLLFTVYNDCPEKWLYTIMIRKPGFLNASRFRVSSPFHKPPSLFIPQHYRLAAYVAEIAHACAPGFQGGGAAHVQNAVDGKRAPVLPADIIRADGSVKGEICVYFDINFHNVAFRFHQSSVCAVAVTAARVFSIWNCSVSTGNNYTDESYGLPSG